MTSLPPLAFRINEVHELGLWGRSTTYKLVREGKLRARKLGGATLILREDLESFLASLPQSVTLADPGAAAGASS